MSHLGNLHSGMKVIVLDVDECVLNGPGFTYLFQYPKGHAVDACVRTDEEHKEWSHQNEQS